jgi:hypothetical protein
MPWAFSSEARNAMAAPISVLCLFPHQVDQGLAATGRGPSATVMVAAAAVRLPEGAVAPSSRRAWHPPLESGGWCARRFGISNVVRAPASQRTGT